MIRTGKVKVAAYQGMPVLPMNKKATVEKACHLIEEAGREGAELLVFPEGFIPMFPNWSMDMQIENEWSDLLTEMVLNGIEIPGEETKTLGEAAKRAGVYVCMGCNEIVDNSAGTLYNSLVFLGPDGRVISHHRKLTPSHRERVLHARGNAEDLFHVVDTRIGRIGGLICYEHLQPLFKYAMMSQGEQIHCACWAGWPGFPPPGRSNAPIDDYMSRAYAIESACFVVLAAPWLPADVREEYSKEGHAGMRNAHWGFIGGSGVINPVGEYVAGPLLDSEGIVYAEIDMREITKRKGYIDPVGKDSRWDVIRLSVDQGHYAPYLSGFPKVRNESEQAVRYSGKGNSEGELVGELRAQIQKLTMELEKCGANE